MADIICNCPNCGKPLTVGDTSTRAIRLVCPGCGAAAEISGSAKHLELADKAGSATIAWQRSVATTRQDNPEAAGRIPPADNQAKLRMATAARTSGPKVEGSFQANLQASGGTGRSFLVQGCLPVFLIGCGLLLCLFGSGINDGDNPVSTSGAALLILGLIWGFAAKRFSVWKDRKRMKDCQL